MSPTGSIPVFLNDVAIAHLSVPGALAGRLIVRARVVLAVTPPLRRLPWRRRNS
jgi:hypothetical protein